MRGCGREQPVGPFAEATTLRGGGPRPPAAGRESRAEGHWFANAPELKGADGGLWEGIVIRGQIAPLLARLKSGGGGAAGPPERGARPASVQMCSSWKPALSGAPGVWPRGGGRGRGFVGSAQCP